MEHNHKIRKDRLSSISAGGMFGGFGIDNSGAFVSDICDVCVTQSIGVSILTTSCVFRRVRTRDTRRVVATATAATTIRRPPLRHLPLVSLTTALLSLHVARGNIATRRTRRRGVKGIRRGIEKEAASTIVRRVVERKKYPRGNWLRWIMEQLPSERAGQLTRLVVVVSRKPPIAVLSLPTMRDSELQHALQRHNLAIHFVFSFECPISCRNLHMANVC